MHEQYTRMTATTMIVLTLLVGCGKTQSTATPTATATLVRPAATPITIATPSPPTATPTDTPPPTPTPISLPAFEPANCRFSLETSRKVECGYLIVPENHSQPDNGKIVRLHVAIFKSTNPNPEPDPVIYLSGSGNQLDSHSYYLYAGGDEILQDRDYIMYNQRGARYNEPTLDCPDLTSLAWSLAREDRVSKENDDKFIERLKDCDDDLLAQGHDLTAYNTVENAADVNDLRIALGYDQVNLYGTSYGTRIALTVMRHHPEGVRSVILDSVYPPNVNLFVEDATNVYRAFKEVFDSCAADAECNEKYPDLETTFYQAVDDLNADPSEVSLNRGDILFNGDLLVVGLYSRLYSADSIPHIPSLIRTASERKLGGLTRSVEGWVDWDGEGEGVFWSLYCNEEIAFATYDDSLAMAAEIPPQISDVFAAYLEFTLCESWESGRADPVEDTAVVSDIPALIFTGQFDPVTPPRWGRLAAETLSNPFFYEFTGLSHGIMRSNDCGLTIGLQFLENPTTEPDSSCMSELSGPDFK